MGKCELERKDIFGFWDDKTKRNALRKGKEAQYWAEQCLRGEGRIVWKNHGIRSKRLERSGWAGKYDLEIEADGRAKTKVALEGEYIDSWAF